MVVRHDAAWCAESPHLGHGRVAVQQVGAEDDVHGLHDAGDVRLGGPLQAHDRRGVAQIVQRDVFPRRREGRLQGLLRQGDTRRPQRRRDHARHAEAAAELDHVLSSEEIGREKRLILEEFREHDGAVPQLGLLAGALQVLQGATLDLKRRGRCRPVVPLVGHVKRANGRCEKQLEVRARFILRHLEGAGRPPACTACVCWSGAVALRSGV
jgi:hypothetical protein